MCLDVLVVKPDMRIETVCKYLVFERARVQPYLAWQFADKPLCNAGKHEIESCIRIYSASQFKSRIFDKLRYRKVVGFDEFSKSKCIENATLE